MKKIILFDSIHYTIKADKLLQGSGYSYKIVTTPREISSDCGMSIETNAEEYDKICEYLEKNNINTKKDSDVRPS